MAWIKLDVSLPEKPEVWQIAGILGIEPDAVVGKLIKVWRWFDAHTEDGNAASVTYALVDSISGVTGFAEAMALCGWLVQSGSALSLPNFDRHNGKTAKNRALTAKRVAEYKAEGNAKGNAPSVTSPLPREEKRREDKKEQKQEPVRSPVGSRLPTDWVLPDEWRGWAERERPDVDVLRESRVFADYWVGQAGAKGRKADWQATWRNWIRRAQGRPRAGPNGQQPLGKQAQGLMALEAMKSGNRMAAGRDTGGASEALLLGVGSDASGRDPPGYG